LPATGFSSFPVAQQEEREEDEWGNWTEHGQRPRHPDENQGVWSEEGQEPYSRAPASSLTGDWQRWHNTGYLSSKAGKVPVSKAGPPPSAPKKKDPRKQQWCDYCNRYSNHRSKECWHKRKAWTDPGVHEALPDEPDETDRPSRFSVFGPTSAKTPPGFEQKRLADPAQAAADREKHRDVLDTAAAKCSSCRAAYKREARAIGQELHEPLALTIGTRRESNPSVAYTVQVLPEEEPGRGLIIGRRVATAEDYCYSCVAEAFSALHKAIATTCYTNPQDFASPQGDTSKWIAAWDRLISGSKRTAEELTTADRIAERRS
jgi:cytochrome c2